MIYYNRNSFFFYILATLLLLIVLSLELPNLSNKLSWSPQNRSKAYTFYSQCW